MKNNYRAGEFWQGVIFRCSLSNWSVTGLINGNQNWRG